jgi:hypothetical protein
VKRLRLGSYAARKDRAMACGCTRYRSSACSTSASWVGTMDEAGEPSPWAGKRAGYAHSRRRYTPVVVLALLFGCGKATTRPAPAEHRPSEGTKSTSAIVPINRDLMRVAAPVEGSRP